MKTINFISIYSGKEDSYKLEDQECLTSTKCPIDGTLLYSTTRNSGRDVWEKQDVYCCPNCGENFHSLDTKRLEHSREIMISSRREKLSELEKFAEHLRKFLGVAEKNDSRT